MFASTWLAVKGQTQTIQSHDQVIKPFTELNTVDRENFAVKIILRLRKIKLRSQQACAQVHTPRGKCPIDDYSEAILGSPDIW